MIFTETIPINLSSPGLILNMQRFNPVTLAPIGGVVSAGFTEIGDGNYVLTADFDTANGGTQGVRIFEQGQATVLGVSIVTYAEASNVTHVNGEPAVTEPGGGGGGGDSSVDIDQTSVQITGVNDGP